MRLDQFTDASEILGGGVYVLLSRGAVVFVGTARNGSLLAKIALARSSDRPKFLPKIKFDQVLIRYVHPDAIDAVKSALVAEHCPKYNLPSTFAPPLPAVTRRV